MPRATIAPDDIARNSPLRLAEAARIAFPGGTMTEDGLRKEAKRGTLAIFRVAGKDFTTLADIERMIEACRVPQKASGSTSKARETKPYGSSGTEKSVSPQAAALAIAKGLKSGSRPTLKADTPRSGGSVISLQSRSQT